MTQDSNPHHLVLGELKDFLTGKVLPDTLDERYRQKIVHQLLFENGFKPEDIKGRIPHDLKAGSQKAKIYIDYLISIKNRIVVLIKYAPGSLVTRRLSTLALSRTILPYQIPLVVVTNGEGAEIIEGDSGVVVALGMNNLPVKEKIEKMFKQFSFKPISSAVFDQASRIVFACEVDGACPCDTDICIIK
ncbi:MAG: type I restriction enzyme HsdR N-terminal domain-containing protein [Desulfobacula sp.]|nr:type I restriction enzyme HsdR N-terminal domain-containing protein [Desulfobacula sp.]